MSMPWMIHVPDSATRAIIDRYVHRFDAAVIDDVDRVPEPHRSHAVVRVTDVRPDEFEVDVYIIGCDWTMTVDWDPDDLRATVGRIVAVVSDPYSFYSYAGDLPDLTPARVFDWFDFDDKPVDLDLVELHALAAEPEG